MLVKICEDSSSCKPNNQCGKAVFSPLVMPKNMMVVEVFPWDADVDLDSMENAIREVSSGVCNWEDSSRC